MNEWMIDIFVIGVILIFATNAYRKGLLKTCFGFLPMAASLGASHFIAPLVSKFLRTTPLFTSLNDKIASSLHLDSLFAEGVTSVQSDYIHNLQIPDFLKNSMLENNNPVVYDILKVDKIQDYISGYLANMCLNILGLIATFVIVYIGVRLFLGALNIVFQLPVLSFFNRVCGLIVGTLQGICIIWIICTVLTFFYYNPRFYQLFQLIDQSKLGSIFFENNLLLLFILKIFS